MLGGQLEQGCIAAADPGVGVADIQAAIVADRPGHGCGHVRLLPRIAGQAYGYAAGRADGLHRLVHRIHPIEGHHLGPLGREQPGRGPPDAAAGAGHQRHPILQSSHEASPCCLHALSGAHWETGLNGRFNLGERGFAAPQSS